MSRATRPARRLDPRLGAVIGVVAIIAVWWIGADTVFAAVGAASPGSRGTIPDPPRVIGQMIRDAGTFYPANIAVTLVESLWGYLWGNLIAIALAALVAVLPPVEGVVTQLAVISYCVPIVAIGPIVSIVIGPPPSGAPSGAAIFLAAMLVFFTTVIGTLLGLRSADRTSLEVVRVYGGGRVKQLLKVRLFAALPATLNALKIAAPGAFLGAIVGEYLGGVDVGVGPALVTAQQTLNVDRAWGLALTIGLVAGLGYAIVALISRVAVPWAPRTAPGAGR